MLIHLIKKDFLIVKKYVLIMFVACILIPPFMLWRVPEYAGKMGFILSAIFSVFMLSQYIFLKEHEYSKAATLLCATPYPRKQLVFSKYISCLLIYFISCLIFYFETLVLPGLGSFSLDMAVIMFFLISTFLGIYMPVQYKLGYEKTKFIFVVVIMASPFVLPQLLKMENGIDLSSMYSVSSTAWYGIFGLVSIIILAVSAFISVHFYNSTDLA